VRVGRRNNRAELKKLFDDRCAGTKNSDFIFGGGENGDPYKEIRETKKNFGL